MANTVIITGASGNMGQAMIRKFLDENYRVIGTLVPADPVRLAISHPNLETIEADLTNDISTSGMIDAIAKKKEGIDVAVLTVGGFAMGSIEETSVSDISRQLLLNFNTAYNVVRPLLKQMKIQGKGRIFLVGSRPGLNMEDSKGMTAYGLSKSLIFRLAELLNQEAGPIDIVTQVIVPSTIDTPQNRKSMPDADFSKWVKPERIAEEAFNAIRNVRENRMIIF